MQATWGLPIIPKNRGATPSSERRERREGCNVSNFEEIGRKIDEEVKRLRELAEQKISPKTRLSAAKSLRRASEALARVAQDLESRADPQTKQ